uniref:Putative DNA repair and recombination protein RAD26-like n=1 Tax=Anthurium amnicola TaxID=1678845 RepID=A0A1D1YFI4_9ARAE
MSLSSLKETLKPPPSSSSSSSSTTCQSSSLSSLKEVAAAPLRRPPKSSLSQQLQRCSSLDLSFSPIPPATHRITDDGPGAGQGKKIPTRPGQEHPCGLLGGRGEEDDDGRGQHGGRGLSPLFQPSSSHPFSSAVRGPFEPLILSSPGEFPLVQVPASINCRLLEHQREGVRFLYSLYKKNHGGILGDDMGLGKTIQTIAFLVAVAGKGAECQDAQVNTRDSMPMKSPVLIVCPTSVIHNWENEFSEWSGFNVAVYHGPNRDMILGKLEAQGVDILVTSFDTFRIHGKILSEVKWEITVVDEAHRLKNEKSQLYKACLEIKTRKRFGLTGTIMQNKILELFNLFDWVSPGSLGTREHFREFYDEPLKHGQRLSAPERFVQIAEQRRQQLASVLQKYLLRRTKEETIGHLMLGKEDNVVFCAMSELQKRVYRRMLAQPEIRCLINKDLPCTCGSPLAQVECCHRTVPNGIIWSYLHKGNPDGCDSCPFCVVLPCILKLQQISNHLELIKPNPRDELEKQKKDAEFASAVFGADIDLVGGNIQTESFMGLSDVEHCGKMRALEKLLSSWISRGDKVLLFSYSVRMLDILEKFLIRKGYCFCRLDGSTPMSLRQSIVDDFNRSPSRQVFLISTRAGGLGLNLVSANRVVIFDPNWNPSQDLQAQDRSFRYGQKRHVVVFRLLAAGSLEELVYTRQVYKQQLSNIAVSGKMEKRYFEGVQDCKEFKGELFGICNLFRDLSDKLFTSEILESYGKNKGKNGNSYFVHDSVKHAEDHAAQEEQTITLPLARETDDTLPSKKSVALSEVTKIDGRHNNLGIVYAHRNEDVVNVGPTLQTQDSATLVVHCTAGSSIEGPDVNTMNIGDHKKQTVARKVDKRIEYSLVAQFKGMEELEFSKWLLAASPAERLELLQDYKRNKQKMKIPSRLAL